MFTNIYKKIILFYKRFNPAYTEILSELEDIFLSKEKSQTQRGVFNVTRRKEN